MKHFGDLNMMFSPLGDDLASSDFVIKPEHYITLGVCLWLKDSLWS